MQIQRCPVGHFYDAERYDSCPLCFPAPERTPEQEPPAVLPEPPVLPCGWLVRLDDPERGREYRIQAGYNYLGSDASSDICISGDPGISPQHAAVLGYDERMCLFSFGPCGGHLPVRVNGNMILDAVILNAYDVLTVGDTRLLFLPLCGKQFNW